MNDACFEVLGFFRHLPVSASAILSTAAALQTRQSVRVDIESEGDLRVPEHLAHDFRMDVFAQADGREGMAQVVKSDSRKYRFLDHAIREAGQIVHES